MLAERTVVVQATIEMETATEGTGLHIRSLTSLAISGMSNHALIQHAIVPGILRNRCHIILIGLAMILYQGRLSIEAQTE